jgi:hypothetical protein
VFPHPPKINDYLKWVDVDKKIMKNSESKKKKSLKNVSKNFEIFLNLEGERHRKVGMREFVPLKRKRRFQNLWEISKSFSFGFNHCHHTAPVVTTGPTHVTTSDRCHHVHHCDH